MFHGLITDRNARADQQTLQTGNCKSCDKRATYVRIEGRGLGTITECELVTEKDSPTVLNCSMLNLVHLKAVKVNKI